MCDGTNLGCKCVCNGVEKGWSQDCTFKLITQYAHIMYTLGIQSIKEVTIETYVLHKIPDGPFHGPRQIQSSEEMVYVVYVDTLI